MNFLISSNANNVKKDGNFHMVKLVISCHVYQVILHQIRSLIKNGQSQKRVNDIRQIILNHYHKEGGNMTRLRAEAILICNIYSFLNRLSGENFHERFS